MRVSVVIVNLNGLPFVLDCLSGLTGQRFTDFEALMVDNGSSDGSVRAVREKFPKVRVIELGANKGFAHACGVGFEQSRSEDLAVLNNDAVPDPDWLGSMVSALDSDPGLGMVACRVDNARSGKFESGGIYPARNGLVYLSVPENPEAAQTVFGVCGVGGLYRGRMLRELGFYPDDFFIYYEDADLAYRCRRAGWSGIYCPSARLLHLGSETTSGMGIKNYYLPRNRLRTVVRNWDFPIIIKCLPRLMLYEAASFWGGLTTSPMRAIKARIDFLRRLPADLDSRRLIFGRTSPGFDMDKWLAAEYPGLAALRKARK